MGQAFKVGLRDMLAQAGGKKVPAREELLAEAAQVRLPAGLGHHIQGRCLQEPADVHGLGGALGKDPLTGRAPGDDGSDADRRRHALGQ